MKKKIAVIGGGTAALFLAAFIDMSLYEVAIYEKKSTLGRKFLVAGDGGFNLSHAEEMAEFVNRYTPTDFLNASLMSFTNQDLCEWMSSIGIETFVGSSQRIFPVKGIKPVQVLNAILQHLEHRGVQIKTNHCFTGWSANGDLVFDKSRIIQADKKVFALGGASWSKTGSDGAWLDTFALKGIQTKEFMAQNCAFKIDWPKAFIHTHEGSPLKNIAISFDGKTQKGEAVITAFGLEGNAIYALSPDIQKALSTQKSVSIFVDFKPMLSKDVLLKKIKDAPKNISTILKQVIKLPPSVIALFKDSLSKEEFLDIEFLSDSIKKFPMTLSASAPIDEAISSSGGIHLSAVHPNFELVDMEENYCIGEMLDWSAPTGGYLIQGCASMGVALARQLNSEKA